MIVFGKHNLCYKIMFGYRKVNMINEIIDIIDDPSCEEPLLFNLYNARGDVVYRVRGVTKQELEKPKVVDVNIPGAALVLNEERDKIRKIQDNYHCVWKSEVKEKRLNALAKLKKETNWKLRVLNEQYNAENEKRKMREKDMRSGEETLKCSVDSKMREGASNLLFFSDSVHKEALKKTKKVKIKESIRRSARIAEIIRRKSLRK